MTKFYLDLHECGSVLPDQDGVEVDHLDGAKMLALAAARDIMCGEISGGTLCLSCFIEICDDRRQAVERVMFRDAIQNLRALTR